MYVRTYKTRMVFSTFRVGRFRLAGKTLNTFYPLMFMIFGNCRLEQVIIFFVIRYRTVDTLTIVTEYIDLNDHG